MASPAPDAAADLDFTGGPFALFTHLARTSLFLDALQEECLAPFGLMVLFGASSGPVPPFDLQRLAAGGSLYITRPTLGTYTAKREDLLAGARELFDLISRRVLSIHVNQRYPLREAARAHRDLEARKTTGSTVLLP